jgi:hypothetical protein
MPDESGEKEKTDADNGSSSPSVPSIRHFNLHMDISIYVHHCSSYHVNKSILAIRNPIAHPRTVMQLRVLTFNLFFEPVGLAPRMRAIGQMVERMRPAVLGFQEVTRASLALLKAQVCAAN